jgi:hypothetical protein
MHDFIQKINPKGGINQIEDAGSPEGVVTAYVGQWYLDTNTMETYRKDSGDNTKTGWGLKGAGAGKVFPTDLLTTSLSAYNAAAGSTWVEITESEYIDLQNDAGSETIGTQNINMQAGTFGDFAGGSTYTFAKNELPSTNNNASIWCFSVYIGNIPMGGVNKVKARVGTNLIDIGNLPSSTITSGLACFVKKGGSASFTTPYLSAVLSSSNASMYYSVPGTAGRYNPGDLTSTTSMSTGFNWGIQGIVRTF